MLYRLSPLRILRGGFGSSAAVLFGVLLLIAGAPGAEISQSLDAESQQDAILLEAAASGLDLAPASTAASEASPQVQTSSRMLSIAGGIGGFLALALIVLAGANSRKRWPKELRFGKA